MKSSLTDIIVKAIVGKKIAKQDNIHPNYWGATITDVYPSWGRDRDFNLAYIITTNIEGNNILMIDIDFEIGVE